MNEFIVWYSNDINEDKFSQEFTLDQLIKQDHLDYISDSKILVNYKVDSINDGIGLKDINGKSLYADSSIVEFEYFDIDPKNTCTLYGYFSFKQSELGYRVCTFDNSYFVSFTNIRNFKIVDTIQENKLGLIK